MSAEDDFDLRAVERFLFLEARLLDEARFEDWLALYTPTATYWVPSQPGQASPHDTVSVIYDDRRLLETRVRRLVSPGIHAQTPPSRTSRLVGNVSLAAPGAGDGEGIGGNGGVLVDSRLQMVEFRRDRQRLFAAAVRHCLIPEGDAFRIQAKRVELVNAGGAMDGITVPL